MRSFCAVVVADFGDSGVPRIGLSFDVAPDIVDSVSARTVLVTTR